MKKLLLVALLAIGVSAVSYAQGGFQRPTPEAQVTTLKTQVTGITDAQAAKILSIYTAQGKKRDSLMAAANGDFQSVGPAMQAMRTETPAKIKAVLTADQQKQFDAIPAPQRGPGGGGPGGPGGGAPGGGAPRN